ncbi:SDR family NAD(P)-dependent oxidoreductase [Pseudonocardia sp. CA-107938]|uniref:SDR family NAD(P)-dependent oxidoreductase n=1 Tax=Pseudonocardia sp. CA-107938 TaxID=3240021 RepID=UPI003D8BB179
MSSAVALVTGAAGGIGAATARRLRTCGMKVVLLDNDLDRGAALAAELDALFVPTDVAEPEDNLRAVDAAVNAFGRIDVAVLNAGIAGRRRLTDFTVDGYRATMRVNLDGVVYGLAACLPHLRGAPAGAAVVVMASIAGLTGSPDVFYAASKHALVGLVRSAGPALADSGVRINALCPGLVDTPALAPHKAVLQQHGVPLAHPDEVAVAVETVLADCRTGQMWTVQAGQLPARVP